MAPFRRWRPLIAAAALWLIACWYFFGDELRLPSPRVFGSSASRYDGGYEKVRWTKLPDRYPVTDPKALPLGSPRAIPKLQKTPAPEESAEGRRVRLERLEAVKQSFLHSWNGYKEHAWGADEVAPLTGRPKNTFGAWGATLVDTLDTLWIMGLKADFLVAVRAAEKIDFSRTDASTINVFETTIRYLGGFLAAYELSERKFPILLTKAIEVAELLMCAFDTPNRMPISRWMWEE